MSMFNLWNVIFSIETWTEVVKMAVVPMLSVFFFTIFFFFHVFGHWIFHRHWTKSQSNTSIFSVSSRESVSSLWSQCSISGIFGYSWYQSSLIKWYKPSTRFHAWAHTYKHTLHQNISCLRHQSQAHHTYHTDSQVQLMSFYKSFKWSTLTSLLFYRRAPS